LFFRIFILFFILPAFFISDRIEITCLFLTTSAATCWYTWSDFTSCQFGLFS
jgi:hypothetical protein